MIMNGYEAFCLFNSLKLHFNQEKYDFFRYNGKSNVSVDAFEKRRDKFHFHKIARKKLNDDEMKMFFVYNLVEKPDSWAGDLLTEESNENYMKHLKVSQSLSYIFENDCRKIFGDVDDPNSLLISSNGDYPPLLKMALQKDIQIETVCLLNTILNFLPSWSKNITDNIRWPEYRRKMIKYAAFLPQDVVKYKLILKKVLE